MVGGWADSLIYWLIYLSLFLYVCKRGEVVKVNKNNENRKSSNLSVTLRVKEWGKRRTIMNLPIYPVSQILQSGHSHTILKGIETHWAQLPESLHIYKINRQLLTSMTSLNLWKKVEKQRVEIKQNRWKQGRLPTTTIIVCLSVCLSVSLSWRAILYFLFTLNLTVNNQQQTNREADRK